MVEAVQGVSVVDYEKQRLAQSIKQIIDAKKMNNAVSGPKHNYELEVLLTQYEKGNRFARFMLVGLGQIHIDAHVSVLALPERTKVGGFDFERTFARGGIISGFTTFEPVEEEFAEGVAEAAMKGCALPYHYWVVC
jgi:hypothetical protein